MSRDDIVYLAVADVIALHEQAMAFSNQSSAELVREDALSSAVHHPRNLAWYANASLATQAVALMLHIAMAHPWVDGNKRTATLALYTFLRTNGAGALPAEDFQHVADEMLRWITAPESDRDEIESRLIDWIERWISQ